MLADFQRALADLTASPELCQSVRADATVLRAHYALTDREAARLAGIVGHAGMAAACTVYRMNRLAPLALGLAATLRALGPAGREVVSEYWRVHPRGLTHAFAEADRFARWLSARIASGADVAAQVPALLAREAAEITHALAASAAVSP